MNLYNFKLQRSANLINSAEDHELNLLNRMIALKDIYTKTDSPTSFFVKGEIERLRSFYIKYFDCKNLSDEEVLARIIYAIAYQQTVDGYTKEIKLKSPKMFK